ncbi:MAG: cyclic nucleotide-binding domain-containing protein [Aggregatilineales bacterium]
MPDRFIETHIRSIPLFQNLPEAQFQLVAQTFHVRRYNPGELVFQQNDPTRGMHLFIEGTAILVQHTPEGMQRRLGTVRTGQVLNQNAVFKDMTQGASLHVVQPVTALFISRQEMARLLSHHPEIAASLGLAGKTKRDHHMHEVRFKTQRANEQVLLKTHRHQWAFMRWLSLPVFVFMGMLVADLFLITTPIAPIFFCLSLIVPAAMALYIYLEWQNDSVIITDQRIIRITHTIATFSEIINEIALDSIQEANYEIPAGDIFARWFNYGTVQMRTSGSAGNIVLDFMPDPKSVQELILEDRDMLGARNEAQEKQAMRADLERWMGGDSKVAGQQQGTPEQQQPVRRIGILRQRFTTPEGGIGFRRHWFLWLQSTILPIGIMLGAVLLLLLSSIIVPLRDLGAVVPIAAIPMFLVGAIWLYWQDWDWRNDYLLVEDNTVSIVHRRPLWLQNEHDQVLLKQIDNVVAESVGVLNRLFGYGKVQIALVGGDSYKVFDKVPSPLMIQGEITRRQARMRQREEGERDRLERERLADYFSMYHDMVGGEQPAQDAQNAPRIQPAPIVDRSRPGRTPVNRPAMTPARPVQQQQNPQYAQRQNPQYTQQQNQQYPPQQPNPAYSQQQQSQYASQQYQQQNPQYPQQQQNQSASQQRQQQNLQYPQQQQPQQPRISYPQQQQNSQYPPPPQQPRPQQQSRPPRQQQNRRYPPRNPHAPRNPQE